MTERRFVLVDFRYTNDVVGHIRFNEAGLLSPVLLWDDRIDCERAKPTLTYWHKNWNSGSNIVPSLGDAAMRLSNGIVLSLLLACSASYAQRPMPKITPIMEAPITGQPDKEFVLLSIEWPPESVGPLHTHPGDEYGIVIKGVYAIRELNGQWKTYTAGEGFHLPAGVVHEDKNMTVNTTTIHSYVVEKGKTLIQPYSKP